MSMQKADLIETLIQINVITAKSKINGNVNKILAKFPYILEQILIHTQFLQSNVHIRVRIVCLQYNITQQATCKSCLTPTSFDFLKKRFRIYCNKCNPFNDEDVQNQIKQTNLEKYGVENPVQSEEVKEQIRQTNLEKYGVRNVFQSEKIKEQIKQTNLKKYGVKNPLQSRLIRKQIKQTNLRRYGVEHPVQSEEVKEQIRQTNLQRYGVQDTLQKNSPIRKKIDQLILSKYGVKYPLCSTKIREKIKQTNLDRYGVKNPLQSEKTKEQIRQTNLEKYGVPYRFLDAKVQEENKQICLEKHGTKYPIQLEKIKQKRTQTIQQRYGTKHHLQSNNPSAFIKLQEYNWLYNQYITQQKTANFIAKELNVDTTTVCNYLRYSGIIIKRIGGFSYTAIQWLEQIMEQENIFIQHANNIGEYQIPGTRCLVDGYCKETNTVYEFHGDLWHGNPKIFHSDEKCHPYDPEITAGELYQRTVKRENKIKELGYNLVIVWESEFTK